jgi:hypothetical protein
LAENVDFKDVAIKVALLILRKTPQRNTKYFNLSDDNYYIMKDYDKFTTTPTLKAEKFEVVIGDVVWNQKKELLTEDPHNMRLIYSSNIERDHLNLKPNSNKDKKPFIRTMSPKITHGILFSRTVSKKIKFYYVQDNTTLVFENHVLILTHTDKSKLDTFYSKLKNGDYDQYMTSFFNSSTLSKVELLSLPYIDKKR